VRLNQFIAQGGYVSRRKADALIKNGKVEVNGRIVKHPFLEVSNEEEVKAEGRLIKLKRNVYIVFHKPKGVTSTLKDKFAQRKITDFIPKRFSAANQRVYPVGRLDKDSSGLIILTNDGNLCYQVTHPRFCVEKEYLVKLNGKLTNKLCEIARRGVKDRGDYLKVKNIEILRRGKIDILCKVIVSEGKKRHLRRLFKILGFKVTGLKRVRIGRLTLGGLKEGEYRFVKKEKIYALLRITIVN
jgi:pseudouridine synthase